ncbi:hypothetical protein [Mycobacteroides franklinii]|uniref:hypothetical protein n=1 Tax=Mycobacteroides franklinii TaxID=948102 RepID=UPI000992E365|nr:hypothetical protein [Mycobacteroides franklinii]
MDGEPDPTSSGPGPGGGVPDDPNAVWRRPGAAEPSAGLQEESSADVATESDLPPGFLARRILELRAWLAGLTLAQMGQLLAVVAVFATAGFGGLAAADPPEKTFAANTSHIAGQMTIEIKRASLVPQIALGTRVIYKEEPGRRYLGVIATLTNNGPAPDSFGPISGPLISPVGIPFKEAYPQGPLRISDATRAVLQPGLTETVAFVWSVPENAVTVGDDVIFRVPDRQYGHYTVGYGSGWLEATTYADITMKIGAPK